MIDWVFMLFFVLDVCIILLSMTIVGWVLIQKTQKKKLVNHCWILDEEEPFEKMFDGR